jgi:hypothetical protein
MFMPVSNSMTNFMDYYSFCIATGPYGYPLPSSPKTHKGTASTGALIERNIVSVTVSSGYEGKACVLLPVSNGP